MSLKEKQKQPTPAPLGAAHIFLGAPEVFVGLTDCIYPMFVYRCVLEFFMSLV